MHHGFQHILSGKASRSFISNTDTLVDFSPIGSPTRPDRDTTPDDTVDIEDPVIVAAAKRLNIHPAVVCVKWAVQRGQIPIPFSIHRNQYLGNLEAAETELALTLL